MGLKRSKRASISEYAEQLQKQTPILRLLTIIRQAEIADVQSVSAILTKAALWLEKRDIPLWNVRDLSVECLNEDVAAGCYFLAEVEGQSTGTLRFTLEDPVVWPDVCDGESAFIHRIAVRRDYAGGMVSIAMLNSAVVAQKRSAGNISVLIAIYRESSCAGFTSGSDFNITVINISGHIMSPDMSIQFLKRKCRVSLAEGRI